MKDQILMDKDFVEEALDDRFEYAQEQWGNDATEAFWEMFKEMVLEQDQIGGTPKSIVDNYVVNSDCGLITEYLQDGESEEDCLDRLDPLWVIKIGDVTAVYLY